MAAGMHCADICEGNTGPRQANPYLSPGDVEQRLRETNDRSAATNELRAIQVTPRGETPT